MRASRLDRSPGGVSKGSPGAFPALGSFKTQGATEQPFSTGERSSFLPDYPASSSPGLRILAQAGPEHILVTLAGEFDAFGLEAFAEVTSSLTATSALEVVADLRRLDFIDASGLAALSRWSSDLQRAGRCLVVRRPPAMLLRVIEVIGDGTRLELEDDGSSRALAQVVDISHRVSPGG